MFDPNRPRAWAPPADAMFDPQAALAAWRDKVRMLQSENDQLHQMLAAQAETITAVQRLVGAPAPATINATVDVKLGIDQQLTPAMQKEIEAFVERLQRIGDGSGPVDR